MNKIICIFWLIIIALNFVPAIHEAFSNFSVKVTGGFAIITSTLVMVGIYALISGKLQ